MTHYEDISIEAFQEKFEDREFFLVDVRETDEYAAGRIPGAVNIPLGVFQDRVEEIERTKPVVLVCAAGGRSAMAAQFMASLGYPELYNLTDGTMGWMQRGLTIER